ncbi:MAG: xanthine dehydrogenase family protein molybdopterin-binding subunit, partial [Armatimonadota bacterium]
AVGITDAGAEPVATAIVRLHHDGSATVHESSTEIGQGVRTILTQIAAEELALPLAHIGINSSDTASTPYDRSTGASRSTTLMGLAVQAACCDLREQLAEIASEALGSPALEFVCEDGRVMTREGEGLNYAEVVRAFFGSAGGDLIGRGYVRPATGGGRLRARPLFWEVGWGAAHVRVDEETGEVRLLRYVSAADVGCAINPRLAEGQDEGAAMMGIGHGLFEALHFEGGQLINGNLVDYRVPLVTDVPDAFETILVESGNGPGTYGAKGMGEGAINPVAPAIAAALARASGVRITDLPLTPERVWRALREPRFHAKR